MRKEWFWIFTMVCCCGISFGIGRATTPRTLTVVNAHPVVDEVKPLTTTPTRLDIPPLEVSEVIDLGNIYLPSRADLQPVENGEIIPASFLPPPEPLERIPPAKDWNASMIEQLPAPREVSPPPTEIPPPPDLKGAGKPPHEKLHMEELEKTLKILSEWFSNLR
ncbi:MAG: hypothetical protein N2112_16850 [Gemmataceae bacterium]|nr:hypothetical protein [Gemmataceae bacterium]